MNRILFFVLFFVVSALGVGWLSNRIAIDEQRNAQIQRFMTQGARFTAQDGQALCERVQALEERSYGFKDAGKTPQSCEYIKR